ncbi:tyrosine-type recombinase/integrase [Flavimaribacter sediminis]|uniref:tyrosine-type recombinase/integrase n=1 Tax=Flavimaribacter sediminis TaxID=2865987 RepID=UPI00215DA268|nr:tyrosine-type recombinase/integrase [Flavimaribacter sediminis]
MRRGDVHKVGPQHVKNGVLKYRAAKNAVAVTVKLPQFLVDTIAATPTGDMRFMVKKKGEAWTSKESFGNWFSKCCREAGLETGKSAHGIRKLAATISADAGATTHELMAQFGWKTVSQAEVYTRGADRHRLGLQSSSRVADHIENIIPRTLISGAGKIQKNTNKSTI